MREARAAQPAQAPLHVEASTKCACVRVCVCVCACVSRHAQARIHAAVMHSAVMPDPAHVVFRHRQLDAHTQLELDDADLLTMRPCVCGVGRGVR
jgi:hypothetical protein